MLGATQNNMNAVERVYQYSNEGTIPQEATYEDSDSTDTPPDDWPAAGEIDFNDVVMRWVRFSQYSTSYRDSQYPSVIDRVSFPSFEAYRCT